LTPQPLSVDVLNSLGLTAFLIPVAFAFYYFNKRLDEDNQSRLELRTKPPIMAHNL
jgi:hypothetical protein